MKRASDKPINWSEDRGPTPADAVVGGAVSWLFVLVGSAAVAAAALIPAYFETLDIQESRARIAAQAEALAQERVRYETFHEALEQDDVLLIERLAMTELRMQKVGTRVAQRTPADPLALVDAPTPDAIRAALRDQPMVRSIENDLSRSDLKGAARDEAEVQVNRPRMTRIVEAATGERRPWVAGGGAMLLLMGLWPRRAAG